MELCKTPDIKKSLRVLRRQHLKELKEIKLQMRDLYENLGELILQDDNKLAELEEL